MRTMKRAFSTLTCLGAGIDEIIEYAKKADIDGVEIRLDKDNTICGLGIEDADVIRGKFAAAGCVITDLATAVSLAGRNDKVLETSKKCIDLAAAVEAKAIRIFVGGHMKTFSDVPNQDIPGIAESVSEMCAYAKIKGVEVWAETHSALSKAEDICKLCDMVDADNLKVLWDVLHSIEFGESPEESIRIMGKRLAHIHLKDAVPPEDKNLIQYRHTARGKGALPLAKVLSLLDDAGYDGYLSLEWELPWHPELAECYPDTDVTLAAFNHWVDEASK